MIQSADFFNRLLREREREEEGEIFYTLLSGKKGAHDFGIRGIVIPFDWIRWSDGAWDITANTVITMDLKCRGYREHIEF